MTFKLDNVMPWGRSYDEYLKMFKLSERDLTGRILGCADGPAEFNAVLSKRDGKVVSVDPIDQFEPAQIQSRIDKTYEIMITQLRHNESKYVWDNISSVENLGQIRMLAMNNFLADFAAGKAEGRYISEKLPNLPFKNKMFNIALSSHFLFLYSDTLSFDFHLRSFQEMLRVAYEIRVFPVLTLDGIRSPFLIPLVEQLTKLGFNPELRQVPYEFQKGGNEMLRVIT
jgi:hypothetical protein